MDIDDAQLKADLTLDEGRLATPYKDTMGLETVGIGHNCIASPLDPTWTFPLTDAQIDCLYQADISDVCNELDADLPWWSGCSIGAQRVLANLGFNMGVPGLLKFTTFLGLMQIGNYSAAADDLATTAWYKEVGERGPRMVARLKAA